MFVRCILISLLLALCAGHFAIAAEVAPATAPSVPAAPSVEPEELKQHMPEKIADMKRGEVNAQKVTLVDADITVVDATFLNPDDTSEHPPSADITFCDYGGNSPMADAVASWAKTGFSRESEGEYEKTIKIQGFPALESYSTQDKYGTMTILVAGRILVTLNVTNLTADQMRAEASALPLKKIAEAVK